MAAADWSNHPPPWRAFPAMEPADLRSTQGAEEAWLDQHWWPFWDQLTDEQREAYLGHWRAKPDWTAMLRFLSEVRDLPE